MTKEYETAIVAHNAAIKIYETARAAYRSRAIGDTEFIAARKEYDAATAKFDLAYAKEIERKHCLADEFANGE